MNGKHIIRTLIAISLIPSAVVMMSTVARGCGDDFETNTEEPQAEERVIDFLALQCTNGRG